MFPSPLITSPKKLFPQFELLTFKREEKTKRTRKGKMTVTGKKSVPLQGIQVNTIKTIAFADK